MKPGIKTTEAWITIALIVLATVVAAIAPSLPEGSTASSVAALVVAGLAAAGYTASRAGVKAIAAWRTGGLDAAKLAQLAREMGNEFMAGVPDAPWGVARTPEGIRIEHGEYSIMLDPATLEWQAARMLVPPTPPQP